MEKLKRYQKLNLKESNVKIVQRAINNEKKKLIAKADIKGLYENFGQKEVRKLEDKFIDISIYTAEMNEIRRLISEFDEWCMNYEG